MTQVGLSRRTFLIGGLGILGGTALAVPIIGSGGGGEGAAAVPPPGPGPGFGFGSCEPLADGFLPWQTPEITNRAWPADEIAEQAANVAVIVSVVAGRGLPTRVARICLITVLAETLARNLGYGDDAGPDSCGMYQQRDPWGPRADRLDPAKSTAMFLDGGATAGTDGLLSFDWQSMDDGAAAQRVQRSAFPDRYNQFGAHADAILACMVTGIPPVGDEKIKAMLQFAVQQVGEPYILGANGPDVWDCSSLTGAAMAHIGITAPRTARQQREWCRTGAGTPIPLGQERTGDLFFHDSYLGPTIVGHVGFVWDPTTRTSLEAANPDLGVGHFNYGWHVNRNIFEIYRLGI